MWENPHAVEPGWDQRWRAELHHLAEEVRLSDPGVLKRELGDALVYADGGDELLALVKDARAPLVLDDAEVAPVRRVRAGRSLPPLTVPISIINAIAVHAATAADGYEVGGRIGFSGDGIARSFRPLVNIAEGPLRFDFKESWRSTAPRFWVVTHTHPTPGPPLPSAADLAWARRRSLDTIGVFAVDGADLGVYTITNDDYEMVPVTITRPPRRRAPFVVRHGEQKVLDRNGSVIAGGYELVVAALTSTA